MLWCYKCNIPLIIVMAETCHPAMPNSNSNCSRVNISSSATLKLPDRWNLSLPVAPPQPAQAKLCLMAICGIIWETSVNDTHFKYNPGNVQTAKSELKDSWKTCVGGAHPERQACFDHCRSIRLCFSSQRGHSNFISIID